MRGNIILMPSRVKMADQSQKIVTSYNLPEDCINYINEQAVGLDINRSEFVGRLVRAHKNGERVDENKHHN
jgi:hypothetical protein